MPKPPLPDPRYLKARRALEEAVTLQQQGRHAEADKAFRRVVDKTPDYFDALHFYGLFKYQQGQVNDALRLVAKASRLNPRSANAFNSLAVIQGALGQHAQALASFDAALALDPRHVQVLSNRGNSLNALGRHQEAIDSADRAITGHAGALEAYVPRGSALLRLGRSADALANYERAIALNANFPAAWVGRGHALLALKRHDEALAAYDRAIGLKPDMADAYLGRGNVLMEIGSPELAGAAFQRAATLQPNLADAWAGCAGALTALRRHEDALAAYQKAQALEPGFAEAWFGHGMALLEMKRYAEAVASYDRALALKPDLNYAAGLRLHAKQQVCDWSGYDTEWSRLIAAIGSGALAADPFVVNGGPASTADHLRCARLYTADRFASGIEPLFRGTAYAHQRIRVAYLSADFREHAVAHLLARLFEQHDKSRFETIAIALGPPDESSMRARLRQAFDRFVVVHGKSDGEVARLIRELEVDVLVDLMGFTTGCRPNVMAFRAAPIQVNYLGYPGITGMPFIDYHLADRIVIPDDERALFGEAIVHLPDSYLGYDSRQPIAERAPSRAEAGLPEAGFVFCAFNNSFKITPAAFSIWMRLLTRVPGSVLWLTGNAGAAGHLRREAAARGVDPERLCFAPFVKDMADHLARYRLADLFVDTLLFNAHTTAADALWAGLPVLTCRGPTFVGRVAASLLHAVGLPEMVTEDQEEYEALALKLATEPALLAATKAKLARNLVTSPMFDSERFTRHVEAAFATMVERHRRGESPASFAVPPIAG